MFQNYSGVETEKLKNCLPKDTVKAQILPIGVVFQVLWIVFYSDPPNEMLRSRGQNVHKTL